MADLARLVIEIKINGAKNATKDLNDVSQSGEKADNSLKKLNNTANNTSRTMNTTASSFKIVGRDMIRYFTVPLTAAAAASAKFSLDLDRGLGSVQTLLADTFENNTERAYEFRDAVTSAASDSGKSFNDLTAGLYQVVSAFQDNEDTIGRFNAVVDASVAGLSTSTEALNLISAVTKAYGDTSTAAAKKASDLAFEAVRLGQTTFPQLANAIQGVTANANRLGVSQEELFAVYATLTGVTGDASEVTTQFSRSLLSLENPTKTMMKLYEQFGVQTGKQFIKAVGGFGNAMKVVYETAEKSGIPLQDLITRQTGIIAASALGSQQLETYREKLEDVADYAGATEKAVENFKEGINETGQTLSEVIADFKNLGAEIGNSFLPKIVTLLEGIESLASGIVNFLSPEVVSLTGLFLGMTGPMLLLIGSGQRLYSLIKSLTTATTGWGLAMKTAFPLILATTAAVTAAVWIYNKWQESEEKRIESLKKEVSGLKELIDEYENANSSMKLNVDQVQALIEKYPRLSRYLDGTTTSINKVREAMLQLAEVETRETLSKEIKNYQKTYKELEKAYKTYQDLMATPLNMQEEDLNFSSYVERDLEIVNKYKNKLNEIYQSIQTSGKDMGFTITRLDGEVIPLTDDLIFFFNTTKEGFLDLSSLTGDAADDTGKNIEGIGDGLKSWEQVFSEVTGTPIERFTEKIAELNEEGEKVGDTFKGIGVDGITMGENAANEYIKMLDSIISNSQQISDLSGGQISSAELYEDAINNVVTSLESLLNYLPELMIKGQEFKIPDNVIQSLSKYLAKYRELAKELKVTEILDTYSKDISSLETLNKLYPEWISNTELAEEKQDALKNAIEDLIDAKATDTEEFKALIQAYKDSIDPMEKFFDTYNKGMEQIDKGSDVLTAAFANIAFNLLKNEEEISNTSQALEGLSGIMPEISGYVNDFNQQLKIVDDTFKIFAATIGYVAGTLLGNVFLDGLVAVGKALATNEDAATSFAEAVSDAAKEILDNLPTMLLQAGLSLLSTNPTLYWPYAVGLIAASGIVSLGSGLAEGYTSTLDEEANAKGNIFSGALRAYASGGTFTNAIVNAPTKFLANGGLNIMGEAGPEAVMPLTRTTDGNLGVLATGGNGGNEVTVNIINNAGAKVSQTTRETSSGKEVTVMVEKMIDNYFSTGKGDRAIRTRFKGVSTRGN